MADEITDEDIANALLAPAEIDVHGQRIKNRSAADLIRAADYLAGRDTSGRTAIPIRVAKIRPDGAT
jgi:hypothetical protein